MGELDPSSAEPSSARRKVNQLVVPLSSPPVSS
jgi:hypothetical protein